MNKFIDYYEKFKNICESNDGMDHFNGLFQKYRENIPPQKEDLEKRISFNAGYEAGFNRGIISAIEMADLDKEKASQILSELFMKANNGKK